MDCLEEIPGIDYLFFKLSPENKKILLKRTEELVSTQIGRTNSSDLDIFVAETPKNRTVYKNKS